MLWLFWAVTDTRGRRRQSLVVAIAIVTCQSSLVVIILSLNYKDLLLAFETVGYGFGVQIQLLP
jgi:hypothetical protein